MSPEIMEFMKYWTLAAFVGVVILFLVKGVKIKDTSFRLLLALAVLYPLGKLIQFWGWGPVEAKSYVSDVGFVSFGVVFLGLLHHGGVSRFSKGKASYWTFMVAVAAIAWEAVQLINLNADMGDQFGPRGDWMDIAIFVAMAMVTLLLVKALHVEPIAQVVAKESSDPPSPRHTRSKAKRSRAKVRKRAAKRKHNR